MWWFGLCFKMRKKKFTTVIKWKIIRILVIVYNKMGVVWIFMNTNTFNLIGHDSITRNSLKYSDNILISCTTLIRIDQFNGNRHQTIKIQTYPLINILIVVDLKVILHNIGRIGRIWLDNLLLMTGIVDCVVTIL